MKYQKNSWKDKIDPAFDKIIKGYLDMLEDIGLIRNKGWLTFKDEYIKKWEEKGSKGWYNQYEEIIDGLYAVPMTDSKDLISKKRDEKEKIHGLRKFKKELLENIDGLPEESQKYYLNKFKPFYSEKPEDHLSSKDLGKTIINLLQDYILLIVHKMYIETLRADEPTDKKVIKMFNFMLASAYNTISIVAFGKNIFELIKEAIDGDQKSFFKALQVDRSIVESNWAIKMIRKAQISCDERFFKEMAKAITKQPFKHDKEFTRAIIVIILFWNLGLNRLTRKERIEIIEECGIRVQDDFENFRKLENRLIRASKLKK